MEGYKHTDLLTPNGVREKVSRVSGEQIRVLNSPISLVYRLKCAGHEVEDEEAGRAVDAAA